jgi:hypothetical protein
LQTADAFAITLNDNYGYAGRSPTVHEFAAAARLLREELDRMRAAEGGDAANPQSELRCHQIVGTALRNTTSPALTVA